MTKKTYEASDLAALLDTWRNSCREGGRSLPELDALLANLDAEVFEKMLKDNGIKRDEPSAAARMQADWLERFTITRAGESAVYAYPTSRALPCRMMPLRATKAQLAAEYGERDYHPSEDTWRKMITALDGMGRRAAPTPVYRRSAPLGAGLAYRIDFGDAAGAYADVSPGVWEYHAAPDETPGTVRPVFESTDTTGPLPRPSRERNTRADLGKPIADARADLAALDLALKGAEPGSGRARMLNGARQRCAAALAELTQTVSASTDDRGAVTDLARELGVPDADTATPRDIARYAFGLGGAEDESTWLLVWGWLTAAFRCDIHRPIMWLHGPQGSGKTSLGKNLLALLDPVRYLGAEPSRNLDDASVTAARRYVPTWDNITSVSHALSDWFCRLVTGTEVTKRALYTDGELYSMTLHCTGVASSISLPGGLQSDALDRIISVPRPHRAEGEHVAEGELDARFKRALPYVMTGLLDDLAATLGVLSEGHRADSLPRMADYGLHLSALGDVTGEDHLGAFVERVAEVKGDAAEDDPVIASVVSHVDGYGGRWQVEPSALLNTLRAAGSSRDLPENLRGLRAFIERRVALLDRCGIRVKSGKSDGRRVYTFTRVTGEPTREPLTDAEQERPNVFGKQ